MSIYNAHGEEIPDPVPVSVPAGWDRPQTLHEMIKAAIRGEFSRAAAEQGEETFEEADDFEIDDDPDPLSIYEIPDAPPEPLNASESLDGPSDVPKVPPEPPKAPEPSKGPPEPEVKK